MIEFENLRERVKAAAGSDRELDCRLWAEFDNRDVREADNGLLLARNRKPPYDECRIGFIDPGRYSRNFYGAPSSIPKFTNSIDAALALSEEVLVGWQIRECGEFNGPAWNLFLQSPERSMKEYARAFGEGRTLPLAILCATLTALIHQGK